MSPRFSIRSLQLPLRFSIYATVALILVFVIYQSTRPSLESWRHDWQLSSQGLDEDELRNMTIVAEQYAQNPIEAPYKDKFWEAGLRSRQVAEWLIRADTLAVEKGNGSRARVEVLEIVEKVAHDLFPFVRNTSSSSGWPLTDLREHFNNGGRGLVIPVGGSALAVRFAGHLIASLRDILECSLPIEIFYAGEDDLPSKDREALASVDPLHKIDFLDITTIFDESILKLREGGWAIKIFAVLASRFREAVLLDADAVFVQSPDVLFEQPSYKAKGAYLFHDRLLWQHAFKDRHEWWHDQIKEPSSELSASLTWTEEYAEECDSGVVVVDKGRPIVLAGLLHTAWQNTYQVREEATYRLGHGDKESWWMGLEIGGSSYEFEKHYGSMLGWQDPATNDTRICSFVIAHTDQKDKLLWYNGSLLKNKIKDVNGYEVPQYWMMDGTWHKGATKADMSCMTDKKSIPLTEEEMGVLKESIEAAKRVDKLLARE